MHTPNQKLPAYITGFVTIGLCLFFLWTERHEPVIVLCSAFLLLICVTDTFYARIPNLANVSLLIFGVAYNIYQAGPEGIVLSVLGLLTGLALLFIPYLAGVMGAGDVKALAALGAVVGPATVFQVFLYTGLIGGVLALFHSAFNAEQRRRWKNLFGHLRTTLLTRDVRDAGEFPRRSRKGREGLRFPYASAIALGFFSFVQWGGLI